MISPIIRIKVNKIVSATKAIIETHIEDNAIIIIKIVIIKTTAESMKKRKQR